MWIIMFLLNGFTRQSRKGIESQYSCGIWEGLSYGQSIRMESFSLYLQIGSVWQAMSITSYSGSRSCWTLTNVSTILVRLSNLCVMSSNSFCFFSFFAFLRRGSSLEWERFLLSDIFRPNTIFLCKIMHKMKKYVVTRRHNETIWRYTSIDAGNLKNFKR